MFINEYDMVTIETDIEPANAGDEQNSRSQDAAKVGGQSSTTTAILDKIRGLNKTFSIEIKSVSKKIDRPETPFMAIPPRPSKRSGQSPQVYHESVATPTVIGLTEGTPD